MSYPADNGGPGAERSLGQLVASATAEMSALVHDEIALAKAELRQDVKRGAMGGAAMSVAGVFALFSLPVLSFAAAYGIHNLGLGLAWSFLIVGGAYLVLAGLLAVIAVSKFKKVKPPERSMASAKQTAAVLGNAKPHPREASVTVSSRPVRPALRGEDEAGVVARSSA
ncbi:phage holin family protein [Streptomyces sp. WAC05374]|uniref:phage holin family protein n=1 Tax=Streptomyces sp. WAC05374 TaxID=2487420 RepID=UPI000F85F1FF|nr:phage holin family protein [Streptomyces sp. WAC05374]RST14951.1 phage holin family protein [Streptomyces sp. WAC05374]TDF44833.1 phage holin family protein [Streptomyces sp. WAC05374]TDF56073.1 phage holin family protein [Streptomyces sp. WAC05374]TDF59754.1 phage holin family protein [Streptomyces sp. WAC05374]